MKDIVKLILMHYYLPVIFVTFVFIFIINILCGLFYVQGCGLFCSEYFLPTTVEVNMPDETLNYVEAYCLENTFSFVGHVSYNGAFILIAWCFSFSTKPTIHNFKESMHTRCTTTITVLLYTAAICLHLYLDLMYYRTFTVAIFILATVAVLLLFYLSPRVYAISCMNVNHIVIITVAQSSVTPVQQLVPVSNGGLCPVETV